MAAKETETIDLKAALRSSGQRYTKQREAVYRVLQTCGTHPTADEVYQLVREQVPHISLATVYKSLESFVHAGIAGQISGLDGPTRFDRHFTPHMHVHSLSDGKVHDVPREIEEETLAGLESRLASRLREEVGFRMVGMSLLITGDFLRKDQEEAGA